MLDYLLWQYKGDIPRGKEPAEFPGAAMWEMGGELLWCWRTPLFHHPGHAHHAARTLEDLTVVLPAEALGHCTHSQGLSSFHQQVRKYPSFLCSLFFVKWRYKTWESVNCSADFQIFNATEVEFIFQPSLWFLPSDSQIKHQRSTQSIAPLSSSGAWWIWSMTCSGWVSVSPLPCQFITSLTIQIDPPSGLHRRILYNDG